MKSASRLPALALLALAFIAGCKEPSQSPDRVVGVTAPLANRTITQQQLGKIRHIVIIMQENRSFDHYFGTFPGADGIPMQNGVPTACVPDPRNGGCVHDPNDKNFGGPHGASDAAADVDHGKMDGFIAQAEKGAAKVCTDPFDPACGGGRADVMGYHDEREIPNYWAYARQFVLQDHMFEPNASWSLPEHLSWSPSGQPSAVNETTR
jgi:phospholipase C